MERYSNLRGKALLFLLFLWFLWFINFITRMAFAPILPLIEDEYAINHAQASSIFIFLSTGYGIAVIASGLFSGKFGYKKSIVLSLGFLSLVSFLIPLVKDFYLLYFFAFLTGFFVGFYLPAAIPLITEYYSEKDWGKAIAIHDTGASSAIFAAPLFALILLQYLPWRGIFLVLACVFVVCSIIFCFISSEVRVSDPPKAVLSNIIRIRSLWLMAIIWVFGAGANLGIYSIVPLYLTKELHLTIDYANKILGFSRFGAIGMAIACGFLIDRFNIKKIMFTAMIIAGMLTVLMGLVSVRYIGIVLFLQAFFVTAFFPMGLVAIAKVFSREMRSLATGIILALSIVSGGGIIPCLLGLSGDVISFRFGITVLGILIIIFSRLVFSLKELR